MTWKSYHRRGEVLRSVIASVDARCDGVLPMDVDGVTETFGDELTLLGALQLRWHTRLAGRIERELMSRPVDLEGGVVAAWQQTAAEMPGVRAVIDHYRAEPTSDAMARAMATAMAKEHVLLSVMAGASSTGDELAIPAGEEIANRARASYVVETTSHRAEPTSLVDRLKAVLAA